ncbi:hypothetical protein ABI_19300 [Asticcacaulis biprosthecium C19]|uniref:Uncharacterized protein n=1 Tax=Asticcacaulis biprosthecium C19 TaxID=715226 RepID=F4QLJ2_9CAUL|nr:hypothetical protein [Asticcacaulis biprosthecium]EGF93490.1 hypothetical protein ABI_19300 [Asticcacaulis biprosthecium C19]
MTDPYSEWHDAYAPLLGAELGALAWLPITADTPDVVANLGASAFVFSGAVLIVPINGSQLHLTWSWKSQHYELTAARQLDWQADCLDRIRCAFDGPWEGIQGGRLTEVRLYAAPTCDGNLHVAGVRHTVFDGSDEIFFWIGCGDADGIGDHDDLWVGVNVEPANHADLVEVLVLSDQAKT